MWPRKGLETSNPSPLTSPRSPKDFGGFPVLTQIRLPGYVRSIKEKMISILYVYASQSGEYSE